IVSFWLPFLSASLGHGALLVFTQNWLYGLALPRQILKTIRRVNYPLIVAGPLILWLLLDRLYPLGSAFDVSSARGWQVLPAAYLVVCWAAGLVAAPALQVRYWLRNRALPLVANHTETVDVATRLGFRPVGRGKHRALAYLPGNE